MVLKNSIYHLLIFMAIFAMTETGCGPKPPVQYQQLQIQDTTESEGYDIYLFVAVKRDTPDEKVEALLQWFRDVKYPQVKKMKVFVWNNPQGALMLNTGDLVGTIRVDRENNISEIMIRGELR